jgi:hypothetical protein
MIASTARAAGLTLLFSSLALAASAQTAAPAKPAAPKAPAAKPAPQGPASKADTRDTNLRAYVELLRSDIRSEKIEILTELMAFTADEDTKFWPIYREYDTELSALNDQRVKLIADYSQNYDAMTDAAADRIATGALDFEAKRSALKAKYYGRMKAALSAKTAARFLQIENQLLMLLDLQISASLPIVE